MKRLAQALCFLLLALSAFCVAGADEAANPDTDIWRKVRADLFGERPIAEGSAAIELSLPARAADAAVVPLSIRVRADDVAKLYVVIDRNPSPIAGVFEFGSANGGTALETRVRIEEYTWLRVIAEKSDGSLLLAQRFIKAAGGCSAPAGKSMAERLAGVGQMKWRIDAAADPSAPASVQLMIRHPNSSGLAMDQVTRLYDPPDYVRSVRITRGGAPVLSADVDFSISENPAFRFPVAPGDGALRATVTDSSGRVFESIAP